MSDYQKSSDQIRPEEDEINLLDYLLVLLKYKTVILVSVVVTFVLACGITLMMPNIYTATARILPPVEDKVGLGGLLG
ncbi:MAG: lipopolysaccharide biosynthesis protein, partial [Desulfuromonadales bacterium]|nr:lipopolysaccharide biosynthesis protein [Desulfuromonadales bacterium]